VIDLLPKWNRAQSPQLRFIKIGPRQSRRIIKFVRFQELSAEQLLVGFGADLDPHWTTPLGLRRDRGLVMLGTV
jgi:hypothetical protein